MKIIPFFAVLGATGVFLASPPSARSQALQADQSTGNLRANSLLNLAGPGVTGVLPPIRLGTGTPSSTTVLRGDGSWVGTTPTGSTIAAGNTLLMGDGAGNAAAVAGSAQLASVLRSRLETQRAFAGATNLLNLPQLLLRNATLNRNGTLTIPANDYVGFNPPGDTAVGLHYCYAVATTDQPTGANGLRVVAYYNGYHGAGYSAAEGAPVPEVFSYPLPGVAKYVFSNSVGNGNYLLFVENNSSAPITIYFPSVFLSDANLRLAQSYADSTPVTPQTVADFDFTTFADGGDPVEEYFEDLRTTLAVDSVNGSDSNAGTLYAPKLTLPLTVPNSAVVGLYRSSLFRASLPLAALGVTHGLVVQDVALGSTKPLPVVSALDPVPNGNFISDGSGDYTYSWTAEAGVANDGYQNVYVVEINTATEAAQPVASRRRMIDATSLRAVGNTAGSCFVSNPSAGQWTAYVHPSDGLAPGSGSYRYEVVSRFSPANWGHSSGNAGDGAMQGVALVGGSDGYGSLGSPLTFVGERLVLLHATTHNAVLGSGSLTRSVFYEGGDPGSIQLAWYAPDPTGLRWSTDHCLFFNNVGDRNRDMLISHSAGGQNYDRGDLSDCAFLGGRWSDGSLHGTGISYDNVNGGTIDGIYLRGVATMFGSSEPVSQETKNSIFREITHCNLAGNFHDNIVLAESGSDPDNVNNRYPTVCALQPGASATNNILWARGVSGTSPSSNDGIRTIVAPITGTVQRNILILNPGASNTNPAEYASLPASVAVLSIDYNLVINLCKNGVSAAGGGQGAMPSWSAYQAALPSLDAHSLFLDLSADPRGLQAVFTDPANGDFRWAQTDVASQCAAFCRANNVGPATVTSHWPTVPTVDAAVQLLTVH